MNKIKEIIANFWISIVILSVLLGGSLFESTSYKTDGPWMKVRKGAKIFSQIGSDTIVTKLSAADSVRFMGYTKAWASADCLVETSEGIRGWMPMWMLDNPVIIASGDFKGDTVMIESPAKVLYDKYGPHVDFGEGLKGTLPNGQQTSNLLRLDVYPAIKDYEDYHVQTRHRFARLMTDKKFERIAAGLNFTDAASKIGPMSNIAKDKDGQLIVMFNTYVFNGQNGRFYNPIITFSADSTAVSSKLNEDTDRSSWLLRYLPLASTVYDWPLTSFFARSDTYSSLEKTGLQTPAQKVWFWLRWIIVAACSLVWLFAIGLLPCWLVNYLLFEHPKALKPLSDTAVKVLYAVLLAVFYYYWMLVLLAWGAYWWIIPLLIGCATFLYKVYITPLDDRIPHTRCPQCRSMCTITMENQNFLDTNTQMENNTRTHITGSHTKRWQEWTQVTKGNSTWRENVQNHSETTTHYRDDHYREKVKYDHYMMHYRCSCCGYKERDKATVRTVLDSQYKGSESYSTTHED